MKTKQFFIIIAIICIASLFSVNSVYGYPWLSPYAYCNNNPVRYIDPDGRQAVVPIPLPPPPGTAYPSTTPPPLPTANDFKVVLNKLYILLFSNNLRAQGYFTSLSELGPISIATDNATKSTSEQKTESESTDNKSEKKVNPKKEAREKAKEKREEQPASKKYTDDKARKLEQEKGKDARRDAHDAKEKGAPDRSKKQIDEDYNVNNY